MGDSGKLLRPSTRGHQGPAFVTPGGENTQTHTCFPIARGEEAVVVPLCKVKPAPWSREGPLWETCVSLQLWLPDPVSSAWTCGH